MFFSLIAKNIWARRTRSLLVALGIGVSVAVIIAVFTLAASLKEGLGVAAQITEADLVATHRGLAGPMGGSIPESCIEDIRGYEGVDGALGCLLATLSLPGMASFNLFGISPEDKELYLGEQQKQIIEGRPIQNRGEIELGEIARGALGLQLGSTLRLESGEDLVVAGIYRTGNVYVDGGGIISLEEAQEIVGREGKVTLIAIYLEPGADEDGIIEQIESEKSYLEVTPFPQLVETSSNVKLANTFAWAFSSIAIVMGCIGVAIAMSMSVSERTREIGILKTLGWSKFRIVRMILGESLLLSLIGFVIGSLLGIVAICAVSSLSTVKGYISPSFSGDSFLIGLVVALLLASLGGVFPAYIAARLSPVEALRHE